MSKGLMYSLGDCLYLGVTNTARGLSLVASRGPSFVMPAASGFEPLDAEPTAEQIVAAVTRELQRQPVTHLVFAGLGDPLTRLQTVCSAARGIMVQLALPMSPRSIRITTNGLASPGRIGRHGRPRSPSPSPAEVAFALADSGITAVSLSLNASSAAEYEALMLRPPAYDPAYHGSRAEAIGDVDGASFDSACAFAVACVAAGLELTATCVDTPGVDANRVKDKAAELGATKFKPFILV